VTLAGQLMRDHDRRLDNHLLRRDRDYEAHPRMPVAPIGESIVSPHIVHPMSLPTKLMPLLENLVHCFTLAAITPLVCQNWAAQTDQLTIPSQSPRNEAENKPESVREMVCWVPL